MHILKRIASLSVVLIGAAAVSMSSAMLSTAVVAKEVRVGPVTLLLASPPGYCELDIDQIVDARAVSLTERMLSTNRLLGFSADCEQLAKYRATKGATPLDNILQYQTLVGWEHRQLPGPPEAVIKSLCEQMRSHSEKLAFATTPEIVARAEQVLKDVRINRIQTLGVVGEDPLACYLASLKKFSAADGIEKAQVIVFAATIINFKIIYCYVYAPYTSSDTLADTLKQLRSNVAALWSANR